MLLEYWCYFVGQNGQLVSATAIKAKDDEEAVVLARRLYEVHAESVAWADGFRLWQRGRLVHSEPQRSAAFSSGG
jgi:hypothetical protein